MGHIEPQYSKVSCTFEMLTDPPPNPLGDPQKHEFHLLGNASSTVLEDNTSLAITQQHVVDEDYYNTIPNNQEDDSPEIQTN